MVRPGGDARGALGGLARPTGDDEPFERGRRRCRRTSTGRVSYVTEDEPVRGGARLLGGGRRVANRRRATRRCRRCDAPCEWTRVDRGADRVGVDPVALAEPGKRHAANGPVLDVHERGVSERAGDLVAEQRRQACAKRGVEPGRQLARILDDRDDENVRFERSRPRRLDCQRHRGAMLAEVASSRVARLDACARASTDGPWRRSAPGISAPTSRTARCPRCCPSSRSASRSRTRSPRS